MSGTPPRGFLPSHPTWLRTLVLSQAIGERRGVALGRRRRPPAPKPRPQAK